MQSEQLYRRYLNKGDIFIHADLEGALPIVVKNRAGNPDAPISPSTLSQAGTMCVSTSAAWDSKAVMSAWWVNANQVTKTAASGGGILPTGSFEVKGEKNFLAPSQLVLGFAILFQVSQESVKNHKQRFEADTQGEVGAIEAAAQPAVEQGTSEPAKAAEEEAGEEAVTEKPVETTTEEPTVESQQAGNASDEEDDEEDAKPAANPLQRGDAQAPAGNDEQSPETESESEEEKTKSEPDTVQNDQEIEQPDDENEGDRSAQPNASQEPQHPQDERKQLSARERRALRQGKPVDRPGEAEPTPARIAPTRGKKAKEKRAAAKYAHQDDEERELALRLLGSSKGKAAKAAKAAEAKEQREREAEQQKARRRAQHERAAEAERKRQAQFAEGADDYNEETAAAEAADLSWLPALVGTPTPEDEILGALPVCAPWAALTRYKYKVKLQPGTVKKGKAVKEIHHRWVSETTTGKVKKDHAEDAGVPRAVAEDLRAREGALIKGWKESEIINTMVVGKVRIMTPGSAGGGGDKGKGKGGGGGGGKGGAKGGKGGKKK